MVILNTCHIRDRAAEKVFSELGRLRAAEAGAGGRGRADDPGRGRLRGPGRGRGDPGPRALSWTSCSGRRPITACPRWSPAPSRAAGAVIETDFPAEDKFDFLPERRPRRQGLTAFLTIQEGCDKFCSFCVVPYTRGAEASRPAAAVLAEARRLVAQGAREITLLGQNVNAWHGAGPDGQHWPLRRG